jgi:hypothetical protein
MASVEELSVALTSDQVLTISEAVAKGEYSTLDLMTLRQEARARLDVEKNQW